MSPTRRSFATAFVAFLMLELAWACVTPLFRGADEISHMFRASAVAHGHLSTDRSPTGTELTRVQPELIARASETCHELYDELRPESCEAGRTYADGSVGVHSSADHYNPVYYAIVGVPSRWLDGTWAGWAMRILSGMICAGLMAGAWSLLNSVARSRWPAAGLLVVVTPAVLFAGSVVAPNGVQFAAALLLWAGLLVVLRPGVSLGAPLMSVVLGAGCLAVTHTTGPLWVATIALSWAVLAGRRGLVGLLARAPRATFLAVACIGLCLVASAAWTITQNTNDPGNGGELLVDEVKDIPIVAHVVLWFFQMIGVMPNRFGILWIWIYALWLPVLLAFLVWGFKKGSPSVRAAMTVALGLSAAIPTVLTYLTYDNLGVAWQGRYGLPLLFGVVLMAADSLDQRDIELKPALFLPLVGVLLSAQYLAMLCLGLRERSGPYDDGRPWSLLLFGAIPVILIGGYVLLSTAVRIASTSPDRVESPSPNGLL